MNPELNTVHAQYIGSGTGEILPILINPDHNYYFYAIKRDNLLDYDGEKYSEYKIIDYSGGRECLLKQKIYGKKPTLKKFWSENKNNSVISGKISFYADYLL